MRKNCPGNTVVDCRGLWYCTAMEHRCSQQGFRVRKIRLTEGLRGLVAPRAYSIIMFGALLCTLTVKFFHAWRMNLVGEYFVWILSDIAVLFGIELVLAVACFLRPRRSVIRIATITATIVCTWSVVNAGWLMRTGTQVLPSVLWPVLYDPIGTLGMVGGNLVKMPILSIALLVSSVIALALFVLVLVKPLPPVYCIKRFHSRITISLVIVVMAAIVYGALATRHSGHAVSDELRYNCQLRAITSIIPSDSTWLTDDDSNQPRRQIPTFAQLDSALTLKKPRSNHNVVIVVLEGVQYGYTSLGSNRGLTPYLASLAQQGVEFTNARSSIAHTTKAMFAILTGRFPSPSHDVAEAVPVVEPYAGIASILRHKLNYRTACFESANGSFESWPGLMLNMGFEKFWAREDSTDPNSYVGYFASDEFSMLGPIVEWIKDDERPFFLVIMCSVSHDPYVVPKWFETPAKEPLDRYRQTVAYTDKFIESLDVELSKLNLADKTIFCVISDHGEALGEHGLFAHERIGFDEVLRVPWVIRAPYLVDPGIKISQPVSSVDLTPTLLSLMGFETAAAGFDGANVLAPIPSDRKVHFSCWTREGPAGFVQGDHKFVYSPMNKALSIYDLSKDPRELVRLKLPEGRTRQITDEIIAWRKNSIFQIRQQAVGKMSIFDRWVCIWMGRVCYTHYDKSNQAATERSYSSAVYDALRAMGRRLAGVEPSPPQNQP